MLPHVDSLTIPLREGIRDIRSSIRHEASAGSVSNRFLGRPEPTRELARLADRILTRAETLASRVVSSGNGDPGVRLDRLAAAARSGRLNERSADIYALCRSTFELDSSNGALISELRLATDTAGLRLAEVSDPTHAAARAAFWMSSLQVVRPCVSTVLNGAGPASSRDLSDQMALTLWLAVLVHNTHRQDGHAAIEGAKRAFEAEGDEWVRLLRRRRLDDLAAVWRLTVPYLP